MTVKFKGNYTLERAIAGSFVNGVYVPGTPATSSISLHWQPLTGADLLNLEEAQRKKKAVFIVSPVQLNTVDEVSKIPADIIIINSERFHIHSVESFQVGICNHYECIGLLENPA